MKRKYIYYKDSTIYAMYYMSSKTLYYNLNFDNKEKGTALIILIINK